jgi:hypothetical protein
MQRFMDEPADVTAGIDDSLASEVGDRVKQIVDNAERDALAIQRQVDAEIRALLDEARAEARERRETAAREAQALAADRVRRILELRREIGEQAGELATAADDPETVVSRVQAFLEALADRADLIAREAGVAAVEDAPEPPEEEAESELAPNSGNGGGPVRERALAGVAADPLQEARLSALRMAVAGASRSQLEQELAENLAAEDATAVLDDVFGSPRSPFPKWSAAMKRAG